MTTTVFGRFLEFSVPTHDIQASLSFYRALGFSELSVGDIRSYHYGAVTDGRIVIGLHAGGIDEPALSFVKSDVASYLQHVAPDDEELSFSRLGSEDFHELGVRTPEGQLLIMMEARTFSQAHLSALPAPLPGRSTEISLGCRDLDHATRYWTDAGFMPDYDTLDDRTAMLAPGLRLGLTTSLPPAQAALCFAPDDSTTTRAALDRLNIPCRRMNHPLRRGYRVTAPEGTYLDLIEIGEYQP